MLRANRAKDAALIIAARLNGSEHPEAAKLKAAVRQWKKSIGLLEGSVAAWASIRPSPHQWKSGIAAWLGWLFDGLDMHLYTLVAAPFVAELLGVSDTRTDNVGRYSSWIQAAFLVGWALGGGFFGRIGDRIGRSRALSLTILTYALFTGLSFFAQTWWQLLDLPIPGRARHRRRVGRRRRRCCRRPGPAAGGPGSPPCSRRGVNIGILLASCTTFLLAGRSPRVVFLVGVLPALLVFWIRRQCPRPTNGTRPRTQAKDAPPGIADLFRGEVRRTTVLTILVCVRRLTAHWAFLFWYQHHLRNLPDVLDLDPRPEERTGQHGHLRGDGGRPSSGTSSRRRWPGVLGYRRAIALMCLAYFLAMIAHLQRAARPPVAPCPAVRSSAFCSRRVRACSRCICRRCSRRCCGPPGPAFATTSAASPRRPARWFSGCSRRWATTAWPCCTPAFSSCRPWWWRCSCLRATSIGWFRWGICGLLFFATTINYIDRQVIGMLKPELAKQLGWSEIDYSNIVFAFQVAYAIGLRRRRPADRPRGCAARLCLWRSCSGAWRPWPTG